MPHKGVSLGENGDGADENGEHREGKAQLTAVGQVPRKGLLGLPVVLLEADDLADVVLVVDLVRDVLEEVDEGVDLLVAVDDLSGELRGVVSDRGVALDLDGLAPNARLRMQAEERELKAAARSSWLVSHRPIRERLGEAALLLTGGAISCSPPVKL